jgi:Zn-dependent protease
MFLDLLVNAERLFVRVIGGEVFGEINSYMYWLILLIGLLIAISIHEWAHAYSAHVLGDDTAKMQGRITWNPVKHFDPIGFGMILFLPFGYGKPVPVNPNNFNNPAKSMMVVSFAGPISNIIQAMILGLLYIVLARVITPDENFLTTFVAALPQVGMINLVLAFFNLLPIFPLDGSKIWGYFHPRIDDFIRRYLSSFPNNIFILFLFIAPIFGGISVLQLFLFPLILIYNTIIGIGL